MTEKTYYDGENSTGKCKLNKPNVLLNREVFDTVFEAKVLVERWRREYNQIRPHSSLGYRPPAPEEIAPLLAIYFFVRR